MLERAATRLRDVLVAGPERLRASGARGDMRGDVGRWPGLTDGRLLSLARECLGDELRIFPDGRMLIWDIARRDGYTIPPYPMAGCGDVKEFLADEGARDVPGWYELHLGMDRESYGRMYEVELVMVRNRARWRRVWQAPSATMAARDRLGGPLWRALAEWVSFSLGEASGEDDARLFKR